MAAAAAVPRRAWHPQATDAAQQAMNRAQQAASATEGANGNDGSRDTADTSDAARAPPCGQWGASPAAGTCRHPSGPPGDEPGTPGAGAGDVKRG
jgi:hypothetical protein